MDRAVPVERATRRARWGMALNAEAQITRARKTSTRNMFLTLIAESDVAHFGQDRERRKREGKETWMFFLNNSMSKREFTTG